jgi:signal transduction histidine kinase
LNSFWGKAFFWKLKGELSAHYKLPSTSSRERETFDKLLVDLGCKPSPLLRRNVLGVEISLYEVASLDSWFIVQRLAHGMKNNLTDLNLTFREWSQMAMPPDSSGPHREVAERIIQILEPLSREAQTLSQLSHLESPFFEKLELIKLLHHWALEYLHHIRFKSIEMDLSQESLAINGDAGLLKLAFKNLVNNALEADQESPIKIRALKMDSTAMIEIINSGVSPESGVGRMFEVGFTTKLNGSGLGIPIANQIIRQHQGTLDIQCDGKWVIVKIQLPLIGK